MQMKRLWHATNTTEHSRSTPYIHCFSICAGRFNCKAEPRLNGLVPFGSVQLGIAGRLSNNFKLAQQMG